MLNLVNLTQKRIRWLMAEEAQKDQASGNQRVSHLLTKEGRADYPSILRDAILTGDAEWLAAELLKHRRVGTTGTGRKKGGRVSKAVSPEAIEAFAKSEFNRYYCRAVCRAAIEDETTEVIVYEAEEPAKVSAKLARYKDMPIGAQSLLEGLREHTLDEVLCLPPGCPRSVLSVRLA